MSSQNVIKTPARCTADFCLIPLGTPTASVSAQIADVQRLMAKSGLQYSMHSAGTTLGKWVEGISNYFYANVPKWQANVAIEGSWDEVMKVIGQAHGILHDKGIVRIQTDIRVGSRYAPFIKFVLCGFFRLSRRKPMWPAFSSISYNQIPCTANAPTAQSLMKDIEPIKSSLSMTRWPQSTGYWPQTNESTSTQGWRCDGRNVAIAGLPTTV